MTGAHHPLRPRLRRAAPALALAAAGCAKLIGLPDYTASTGSGGASGTTTTTGGATTTHPGDAGTGGGDAGPAACAEGATCYDGLDGTEGVGPCRVGSCKGGACAGEVVPELKHCGADAGNENCDILAKCDGHVRSFKLAAAAAADTALPGGPPYDVLGAVAAAADGTFAIATHPQNAGAFVVTRYDAWGRACPSIVAPTGAGTADPHAVALSGSRAPGQVRCDGSGTASPVAETIVAGEATGVVDFGGACAPSASAADRGFVVRYDAAGHCKQSAYFLTGGAGRVAVSDVIVGNVKGQEVVVAVGGATNGFNPPGCTGTLDPTPGYKTFLLELSADLQTCLWATSFPASTSNTLHAQRVAAVPPTGAAGDAGATTDLEEVILAGTFTGTLSFGSKVLSADPDAGMAAPNAFAVKVSLASSMVTSQAYALDGAGHRLNALAVDPGGSVILAGSLDAPGASTCAGEANGGASTGYLYVLDPALGGSTGHLCFPTSPASSSSVYGLAVDGDANVSFGVVHGATLLAPFQSPATPAALSIVKVKTSSLSTPIWTQTLVSTTFTPFGVAVDGMGDVLLGGIGSCQPAGCAVTSGDHAVAATNKIQVWGLQLAP